MNRPKGIVVKTADAERLLAALREGHPLPPEPRGPGTELKRLLGRLGIEPTPGCPCNARAAEMDARGPDWCEANVSTILGWLEEESTRRGRTFYPLVAKVLVRRAIRNARRATG